jgi:DnaJ-class molecular chaperone
MIPYWLKDLMGKLFSRESKRPLVPCEVCDGKGNLPIINTDIVENWEITEHEKCSKCNGKGYVRPEENLSEGF